MPEIIWLREMESNHRLLVNSQPHDLHAISQLGGDLFFKLWQLLANKRPYPFGNVYIVIRLKLAQFLMGGLIDRHH